MDYLEGDIAVGLDLGTTFSCIGVYRNGGVEIIPNQEGEPTTPSIITILDEDNILRGEETLNHLVKDSSNTIYDIKRFIGRDLNDEEVKKEMKLENFPFKIIINKQNNSPLIEINKNKKNLHFTLEEISSFIIRKMVDSAENYLNKKVKKLVITVPANFNDAQRNCTKQAALLAGVEAIRIINEPTAAALAYGLQEKNIENNKKILIFDLGGGTFDVTILSINKEENNLEKTFDIMSTNGDKYLGGEDFDKILVEYFLDRFCRDNNVCKEKVKEDIKGIRKLKISCEKIKRSFYTSANKDLGIYINNFYGDLDLSDEINNSEFENLSKDLIKRLNFPLEQALFDANLDKNDISEIILVGGSTKLPIIKRFLYNYFKESKINDSINPDEAVAYGATLMAAKILIRNDNLISSFNLLDITPFPLGIAIYNDSIDDKIKQEGKIMSIIIKGGTKIPYLNTKIYKTSLNNQTKALIEIYEGNNKYVKYNKKLGSLEIKGLTERQKGEVKVNIKFFIDVNGILNVTVVEDDRVKNKNNKVEAKFKNDMVNLTEEEIKKLKKKNEKYQKYKFNLKLDYNDLKKTLNEFKEAYIECEDIEDKYNILMNYNNTLEEFIGKIDKNFDNEIMAEKYYFYIKKLFFSYSKILNMKEQINNENQKNIIKKIKKYIDDILIYKIFGYLEDLIEIIKDIPKKMFFQIIIFIIEKYNERGKMCIKENVKFCRFYTLFYFKKSLFYFNKYIKNTKNIKLFYNENESEKIKHEIVICNKLLQDIDSGQILLSEDSIKQSKLFPSPQSKAAKNMRIFRINDELELYSLILENYKNMFLKLKGKKRNQEEAIILANIVKIKFKFLGLSGDLFELGEKFRYISEKIKINPNIDWYKEIQELLNEIYSDNDFFNEEFKQKMKIKYQSILDEIDKQFYKRKHNINFVDYILNNIPYKDYEEDKNNNIIDFKNYSKELINYLLEKYNINKYHFSIYDESCYLNFLLIELIHTKLEYLYNNYE